MWKRQSQIESEIMKTEYRNKDNEVKKSIRRDERKWTDDLTMTAEKAAYNGRMKELYA